MSRFQRTLITAALFALALPGAPVQQSPCDCRIGRIAGFDFAVKVARPAADANAILRWCNLFWAARFLN